MSLFTCPLVHLLCFLLLLQYPDYVDAYLRLAAIAKDRNDIQLSIALVCDELYILDGVICLVGYARN